MGEKKEGSEEEREPVEVWKLPPINYEAASDDPAAKQAVSRGACPTCYGLGMVRRPGIPVGHRGFGGVSCPDCQVDEHGE